MASLRILHLASFAGNIGDNLNHMGFRPWFERMLRRPVLWTDLEMREFYWRERFWDRDFVEYVNGFDMLVVGGGNYFELWVENSATGMSFGLAPDLMRAILVPVFFNALGVDTGQGAGSTAIARSKAFFDTVFADPRQLVSVRNDGSKANAAQALGTEYAERMAVLPDGGFFSCEALEVGEARGDRGTIAINLACDMADIRFGAFGAAGGRQAFAAEMALALTRLCDADSRRHLVFVPHVYHDLEMISDVVKGLSDRLRRTRISVAPFGSGDTAARTALAAYRRADLVLGMRFHANVGPMSIGKSCLGLAGYPQITQLFTEIGQPDRVVSVGEPGFADRLVEKAEAALGAQTVFTGNASDALEVVTRQRAAFEPVLRAWIERNGSGRGAGGGSVPNGSTGMAGKT